MNRTIIYSQEQIRSFDVLSTNVDALMADANARQFILGKTNTLVQGFTATPTFPTTLQINIAPGFICSYVATDNTAYGALPANSTQILQLGQLASTFAASLSTGGLAAGQSQWVLIEATFLQTDVIRTNDPNSGVLPYINASNPTSPYSGPNNSGAVQNTEREALANIQILYGAPATSGTEVPPSPSAGYVPLCLVDLTYGQTTISAGQIIAPSAVSGYGYSEPLFNGFLNSHHNGSIGQAPQILLGSEVQGNLPIANMVASNTVGAVPSFRSGSASTPNGTVAGNNNVNGASDFWYSNTAHTLWVCTTTGTASTAVWTQVTPASTTGTTWNLVSINATTTYTPTTGAKYAFVELYGGGGGGGGGTGTNTGTVANGGGGGGGAGGMAYGCFLLSSITTPVTVTIGAGGAGAGGSSGTPGSGGSGGVSYFGAYMYATGGSGGGAINPASEGGGAPGNGGTYSLTSGYASAYGLLGGSGGGGGGSGGMGGSNFRAGSAAGAAPYGSGFNGLPFGGGGGGGGCTAKYAAGGSGGTGGNGGCIILEYIGP